VFDFPERIYLSNPPEESDVNAYYVQIIQDILDSLPGPKMTIQTHIVNRIERAFAAEETWNPFEFFRSDKKKQIDHVMLQIGDKITQVVFDRWNDIFGVKINDKTIDVKFEIEPAKSDPALRSIYLTVLVRDGLSNFSISERSLGFRWFFCFLLFTHFRGARADINTVFLFDEPASNLHSRAQEQLLKSFSTISAGDNVIIYSTHSHYMIEPRWLEGAFIVHNDAINYDSPADEPRRKVVSTNVHVSRYREFAEKNPEKTTYFQPILDTLQYGPSKLEIGREAIFVEGKNDFYMLEYFCQLLKRESDCRFIPGVGANDLEPIISMYLGWRTNFYILLDDDGAGRVARNRYREDYFLNESQVGTLGDAAPEFAGKKFEKLLSEEGKKRIDLVLGRKASKKDLGRFFQEKAAIKDFMEFDETTLKNFEVLVDYCKKHLAK
jgi:hypothetical protein